MLQSPSVRATFNGAPGSRGESERDERPTRAHGYNIPYAPHSTPLMYTAGSVSPARSEACPSCAVLVAAVSVDLIVYEPSEAAVAHRHPSRGWRCERRAAPTIALTSGRTAAETVVPLEAPR